MDDLRQRFATLDLVPVPDVWSDVERRLETLGTTAPTGRLVAVQPKWRQSRADPFWAPAKTIRRRRNVGLLAAAALTVALLVGGALAVGSGLIRLPSIVPPSPEASLLTPTTRPSADASPSPIVTPSPTPNNAFPPRSGMFADLRDSLLATDTVGWVSTGLGLYRTEDTGRTWTEIRPQGLSTPAATVFVDADTMYAASGGSPATIAATHDGGASWIDVNLDVGAINGGPVFSFQTPLLGFATFYDPNTTSPLQVFATTDGGLTWTGPKSGKVPHMAASMDKLYPPIGGYLWQSGGKFDNKPYDNRFFLSADGGASWMQYTFPIDSHFARNALKSINGIAREDNGRLLVVFGGGNGGRSAIYESGDDTASWRLVSVSPPGGNDVQLLSPTEWILFSTAPSEIRSTTDAGLHWRTTTPSISLYYVQPATAHQFATPNTGWATEDCHKSRGVVGFCDGKTDGPVFAVTTDGGVTWTRIGS